MCIMHILLFLQNNIYNPILKMFDANEANEPNNQIFQQAKRPPNNPMKPIATKYPKIVYFNIYINIQNIYATRLL